MAWFGLSTVLGRRARLSSCKIIRELMPLETRQLSDTSMIYSYMLRVVEGRIKSRV